MKVILQKDVPKLGQKGDVKSVSDGHARNYLIPRGLVEPATPEKLKALEARHAEVQQERERESEAVAARIRELNGKTVQIAAPANEQGHLYKGLTREEVRAALVRAAGGEIPDVAVENLPDPLKDTGEHTLTLAHGDIASTVTIEVTPKA